MTDLVSEQKNKINRPGRKCSGWSV